MEYRYLARDGRVVWVVDHATLRDAQRCRRAAPVRRSDGRRDRRSVRRSRPPRPPTDRLHDLVEHGPAVLFGYALEGDPPEPRVDYLSPRLGQLLGLPSRRSLDSPRKWFAMIHPDDRERVASTAEHAWEPGTDWDDEYRMLAADGSIVWIQRCRALRAAVARDDRSDSSGSCMDVTDRRLEADRVTTAARDRWTRSNDGIPAILWTEVTSIRQTGTSATSSSPRTSVELTRVLPGGAHRRARTISPGCFIPTTTNGSQRADAGRTSTGVWDATYRIIHRDGTIRWLHSLGRRGAGPDPKASCGTASRST